MEPCEKLRQRGGWAEDEALGRCFYPIGPRNTYSNIAYVVAAIWVGLARPGIHAALMGGALISLAYGSWRYHAEKTVTANLLDRMGMGLVFSVLACCALFADRSYFLILTACVTLLGTALFTLVLPSKYVDVQVGIGLTIGLLGALWHGAIDAAVASMVLFLMAYGVWHLDKAKSRYIGLWGHAIWHVLTAAAIGQMFLAQAVPQ